MMRLRIVLTRLGLRQSAWDMDGSFIPLIDF